MAKTPRGLKNNTPFHEKYLEIRAKKQKDRKESEANKKRYWPQSMRGNGDLVVVGLNASCFRVKSWVGERH